MNNSPGRMNVNLGYSVIPGSGQQQVIQLPPNVGFVGLQQPQPIPLPNNNGQFVFNGGYQPQTVQQGMESFAFPSNLPIPMNGPSPMYTCVTQNGMTYLAVTPNIQQPQCYQAVQTPQGLQLFQVVNNNQVNFNSYCIPTADATLQQQPNLIPQYSSMVQETHPVQASTLLDPQQLSVPCQEVTGLVQYAQPQTNQSCNETNTEEEDQAQVLADDSGSTDGQEDEETCTQVDDSSNHYETPSEEFSQPTLGVDPLAALTSLTSSISTPTESSSASSIQTSSSSSYLPTQMDRNQMITMGDQQFPPNTRAFQVLVPTPQGMAIQTVVASYPPSPMNSTTSSSFQNLDPSVNPQLVNLPPQPLIPATALPPCNDNNAAPVPPPVTLPSSAPPLPALIQVKDVTSPCHSTTSSTLGECYTSAPESSKTSVPLPSGSPHCLPDSTDDLCQPTIKQSKSSIVDGIDLEDIREFAKAFKMRRLALGLTQTQVGHALCATEGPAYSQSAICRFEKLDITPRSAMKIRPVLEQWLREAEEKHQQGQLQPGGMEYIHVPTMGKVRKRRTFFSPEALEILNGRFERHSHPSGREITSIANEIGYERDVVRVWFCNKRQSLRQCHTFHRTRSSKSALKATDSNPSDGT